MNKYYLIIEKCNNFYSIVNSLGSSQSIDDSFTYNQEDNSLIYKVQSASDVLHLASYIFTRRGDYKKASNECNKLYAALKTYLYVSISYEELMALPRKGSVDLKGYLISEEQFLLEIKESDGMKSVLEMNSLTERKPRKEVLLEVAYTDVNWCYTTDFYSKEKLVGKTIKVFSIPLDVTTKQVKDYITSKIGVNYKFNF